MAISEFLAATAALEVQMLVCVFVCLSVTLAFRTFDFWTFDFQTFDFQTFDFWTFDFHDFQLSAF